MQLLASINVTAIVDVCVFFQYVWLFCRYLLVSTDGPRILMLRTSDWSHVRSFYGQPTEQFHNPCAAWHRDGHYVYAATAGAQVCV